MIRFAEVNDVGTAIRPSNAPAVVGISESSGSPLSGTTNVASIFVTLAFVTNNVLFSLNSFLIAFSSEFFRLV